MRSNALRALRPISSLSRATIRSLAIQQRSLGVRTIASTTRKPASTPTPSTSATSSAPAPPPAAAAAAAESSTDTPLPSAPEQNGIDWSSSFHGLSTAPFPAEAAATLQAPVPFDDVEIKPDGIIYLPEIKYRRVLNAAFGPGGWGLAPRGDVTVADRVVTREYALVVHGRFVAQARGENQFFSADQLPAATEGCKSNALMRCCKDLGVASELWDPRYIREFKKTRCRHVWAENAQTGKKKQVWIRKGDELQYPYKATS